MTESAHTTEILESMDLNALVSVKAYIPEDAMTAGLLGTERAGHAVRIRPDGLLITIGYLVNEADEIWVTNEDGQASPAFVIGNDFRSGLALLKASPPLQGPPLTIARADALRVGDAVTVAGSLDSDPQTVAARVVSRQEFAGRWEYLLEEAIFTAPPHPSWSGAALVDSGGHLCGIGSLVIQGFEVRDKQRTVNMFVPIDAIAPYVDEICEHGRRIEPPRPWLGVLVHDENGELTVVGVYRNCPADNAGIRPGDTIIRVDDQPVYSLGHFFRTAWSLGPAGVDVPITVLRSSARKEIIVRSAERGAFLWRGTLQ